jgi:leucyl aminopeptidase
MHTSVRSTVFSLEQDFPEKPMARLMALDKKTWDDLSSRIRQERVYEELIPALGLFDAEAKEILVLPQGENRCLYLLGLGKDPGFPEYLGAFRSFFFRQKRKLPTRIGIEWGKTEEKNGPAMVEAVVNGAHLSLYDLPRFKTAPVATTAFSLSQAELWFRVPESLRTACTTAAERGAQIGLAQLSVMEMVNAPANKKSPGAIEEWAQRSGHRYGYRVTSFDRQAMEALGLHALLAVNRGSNEEPVFLVLEYRPGDSAKDPLPKIGLLGKGVTFDTGGISLKDSNNLHFMKSDMAGAGAVLGAVEAAARLSLPVHLVAVVPITPNDIGPNALRPGDVIGSYAGKTIEIIDTDAEGRLILADGLSYLLRNHSPDVIVDLATLTGSCVATFGYVCAGMFTANDELAARLARAGEQSGERVWRLPLWDAWASEIKSDIADLKNYHGKPIAGAIVAAKFLEAFAEKHPAWAHLDMAGVAFTDGEFSGSRSATAWGVRLLVDFFENG